MVRPHLLSDILPLSDFRANNAALLEQLHNTHRPLVITQHGKSAAVVLTPQDYENLLERIEMLSDIRAANTDIEQGKTHSQAASKKQAMEHLRKRRKES
jgi:antitoxin YefM